MFVWFIHLIHGPPAASPIPTNGLLADWNINANICCAAHSPAQTERERKSFSSSVKIFIHEFSQLKQKRSRSIYGGPPSSDNSCTDRYTQTEPQTKNTVNMHHVHHMHVMMHGKLWAIISLLRSAVLINTAYGRKPCCVCACVCVL